MFVGLRAYKGGRSPKRDVDVPRDLNGRSALQRGIIHLAVAPGVVGIQAEMADLQKRGVGREADDTGVHVPHAPGAIGSPRRSSI